MHRSAACSRWWTKQPCSKQSITSRQQVPVQTPEWPRAQKQRHVCVIPRRAPQQIRECGRSHPRHDEPHASDSLFSGNVDTVSQQFWKVIRRPRSTWSDAAKARNVGVAEHVGDLTQQYQCNIWQTNPEAVVDGSGEGDGYIDNS